MEAPPHAIESFFLHLWGTCHTEDIALGAQVFCDAVVRALRV